jgi:hypothetical protein
MRRGEVSMKRISFSSPEELAEHCKNEETSLIVEFKDDAGRQQQVTLSPQESERIKEYMDKPESMAYFRKDGIFFEVVPDWRDQCSAR